MGAKLEAFSSDELRKMATNKGLTIGKKDKIVEVLLAHEAKLHEAVRMHATRVQEILDKKKIELELKPFNELKDLCISKTLPTGTSKQGSIQHLLEDFKNSGEADRIIVMLNRDARAAELHAMDMELLRELTAEKDVNPLVKEIMVERLLAHENEH